MAKRAGEQGISELLSRIWEEKKNVMFDRIAAVESAVTALRNGSLSSEVRSEAAREEHKLAGALGTLGFPEAARLSMAIEKILKQEAPLDGSDAMRLTRLTGGLRDELSRVSPRASPHRR